MWMLQTLDTNNNTVEPVHTADVGAMAVSSRVLSVRSLLRLPFHKILLEMLREIRELISSHEY